MFELIPEKFLTSLHNWSQSHGSLYDVFIFNTRMRIISDCDLAIELMQKRPKTFRRGKTMAEAFEHLDIGIPLTASEGERWAHLRRVASPQFNHKNITAMIHVIKEEAESVVASIECECVVKGTDMCTLYAASTIGRLTLGIEACDMNQYFGTKQLVSDLDIFVNYLIERMFYPLPKWTWKYSKAYQLEIQAREANGRMDSACKTHIQNIRRKLSTTHGVGIGEGEGEGEATVKHRNQNQNQSLIEILISNNDKDLMSDADCILNVKTVLGAGADTTGIATTWVLYYLAQHPECMDKIRAELKSLGLGSGLGSGLDGTSGTSSGGLDGTSGTSSGGLDGTSGTSSGGLGCYEDVLKLKYSLAVVKEAIRRKLSS